MVLRLLCGHIIILYHRQVRQVYLTGEKVTDKDKKEKRGFTIADYWIHFGVLINLVVVLLLLFYTA